MIDFNYSDRCFWFYSFRETLLDFGLSSLYYTLDDDDDEDDNKIYFVK